VRQQVAVLKRQRPRPNTQPLGSFLLDRVTASVAEMVGCLSHRETQTVVGWHRAGWRLYWRRSRLRGGRPKVSQESRALIRRLATENSKWGAPKVYGELQKLGFKVSERAVAYLKRLRRRSDPGRSWQTFLANHREAIVAMDFFTHGNLENPAPA
jgi:putative transposase